MSEPIINPWLFYLMDVSQGILGFSLCIALASFVGLIFIGLICCDGGRSEYYLTLKVLCSVFIVTSLLSIFIPAKETIMQMVVASVVTPENIQMVGEGTEAVASKILGGIIEGATKLIQEVKK